MSEQPTPRSFHGETSAKIRNFVPLLSLFFSLLLSLSTSTSSFSSSRNGKNRDRTRGGKGKRGRVVALVRAHNAHFSGTPRIPSLRFPQLAQFPLFSLPLLPPIPFLSLAFSPRRTKVARLFACFKENSQIPESAKDLLWKSERPPAAHQTKKEELISHCLKSHFYVTLNVLTFVVMTEAFIFLKERNSIAKRFSVPPAT